MIFLSLAKRIHKQVQTGKLILKRRKSTFKLNLSLCWNRCEVLLPLYDFICYHYLDESPNLKLHCYRAVMEVFIRRVDPALVLAPIRCKKIKNAAAMSFEE